MKENVYQSAHLPIQIILGTEIVYLVVLSVINVLIMTLIIVRNVLDQIKYLQIVNVLLIIPK
jgi:hypothetical protein